MYLLYWLLFTSLLHVHVEADGIVENALKDGIEEIRTDFLKQDAQYKQFLECSYIHNFELPTTNGQKITKNQHVFFLQCIQLEGSEEAFVVLYFNSLAVDRLVVKSCDKKEVENSIFPPKLDYIMGYYYGNVHLYQSGRFSSTFRFLKIGDNRCYKRTYAVELNEGTEAFKLIERKSITVTKKRAEECAHVKFTNCRAPPKELTDIVTQYSDTDVRMTSADWIAYINDDQLAFKGDIEDLIIRDAFQCTVQYPGPVTSDVYYELVCVKVEENGVDKYLAFVNQRDSTDICSMEIFAVTSCSVSLEGAIFPGRNYNPQCQTGRLRFKHNGKCYERKYVKDQPKEKTKEIDCPSNVLDWVNPKKDSLAMWGSCKTITSPIERNNKKNKVHVEADGIVKNVFKNGNEVIPTDFLNPDAKYKQFLECSHIHNFESTEKTNDQKRTKHQHVFFLQCIQLEGSEEAFVVLYFNSLAVDRMVVKSCVKKEVESSIFPPKLEAIVVEYYGDVHDNRRERVSPKFRFLKDGDDKCHARRYTVGLTKNPEEFGLIERRQPIVENTGDQECGVVKFFNCRAPYTKLTDVVIQYSDSSVRLTDTDWIAYINNDQLLDIKGESKNLIIRETLQCTVQCPGSKTSDVYYELVCVKVEQDNKGYKRFVFINQRGSIDFYNLEIFEVKSCRANILVSAIFLGRDNDPKSQKGRLRFKHNGKCYERKYVKDQPKEKPKEIDCPRNVLDWVNPRKDGLVRWRSCKEIKTAIEKLSVWTEI